MNIDCADLLDKRHKSMNLCVIKSINEDPLSFFIVWMTRLDDNSKEMDIGVRGERIALF